MVQALGEVRSLEVIALSTNFYTAVTLQPLSDLPDLKLLIAVRCMTPSSFRQPCVAVYTTERNVHHAQQLTRSQLPALVLLDDNVDPADGFEYFEYLRQRLSDPRAGDTSYSGDDDDDDDYDNPYRDDGPRAMLMAMMMSRGLM